MLPAMVVLARITPPHCSDSYSRHPKVCNTQPFLSGTTSHCTTVCRLSFSSDTLHFVVSCLSGNPSSSCIFSPRHSASLVGSYCRPRYGRPKNLWPDTRFRLFLGNSDKTVNQSQNVAACPEFCCMSCFPSGTSNWSILVVVPGDAAKIHFASLRTSRISRQSPKFSSEPCSDIGNCIISPGYSNIWIQRMQTGLCDLVDLSTQSGVLRSDSVDLFRFLSRLPSQH